MRRILVPAIIATVAVTSVAQTSVGDKVRQYTQKNQHQIISEFIELLSIPNVASDTANINKNAVYLKNQLQKRGLTAKILRAKSSKVAPSVFGEWKADGAKKTIVFYAHFDGQPVDRSKWIGSEPWKPILRSDSISAGGSIISFPKAGENIDQKWRIYARSASDDKGGVFTLLKAIDALKANTITPTVNIKVFLEGEEEAGSSNLREIILANKGLLKADAWIICDGPVHQSGRKQVVFGVRGVTSVSLTVYGANRDLHSGHYGNWSPSPGFRMVRLLSSMRDKNGKVVIPGWYDDVEPLGEPERKAIAAAPQYDRQLMKQLGLNQTEGSGKSLLELLNLPSLNINGMKSGNVGKLVRNVIPATAEVVLGLRLVKGNDHRRQIEKLRKHVVNQGFYITERDPTDAERIKYPLIAKFVPEKAGYNAQRTRMDLPVSLAVIKAVKQSTDQDIVSLPTLGGSLPLSIISESLDNVPTIGVPIANFDNNQHAANENIRIKNLWDGIAIYANLMTMRF